MLRKVEDPSCYATQAIRFGYILLLIGYTFPISVPSLIVSEDKESKMAGSGMPLNVSREAGLRQVAMLVMSTTIASNASTT